MILQFKRTDFISDKEIETIKNKVLNFIRKTKKIPTKKQLAKMF